MHQKLKHSYSEDFKVFWAQYPRRVGKLAAEKEYAKVRRGGIGQDELLDGIAQYIATKPAYADFCHPRTWLAQGRWMDEVLPRRALSEECQHEPRCPDRWSHGQLVTAEASADLELVAAVRRLIAKKVQA